MRNLVGHPDTLMLMQKNDIKSIMDYAFSVYFSRNSPALDRIEKIQFSGIRSALGYRFSTPTILPEESRLPTILCQRNTYETDNDRHIFSSL